MYFPDLGELKKSKTFLHKRKNLKILGGEAPLRFS